MHRKQPPENLALAKNSSLRKNAPAFAPNIFIQIVILSNILNQSNNLTAKVR